ncbi:MAG: TolC family protein [Bacteroidetes bacterium]|nr:TolC family protein [Bacteroidota bacterium]
MNKIFLLIFLLIFSCKVSAQDKMTLQQAIETGIKMNLQVQQSTLAAQSQEIQYKQARALQLPDLNASANHGINQGRSIDPFTNNYVNQNVFFASYGINTNLILFQGGALRNQVAQNKIGWEASLADQRQAKDNLTLNIILAYLQILSAEEVLVQSIDQATVTQRQLDRLGILNAQGAILPANYFDVKGQLANEQITIADNKINVATAKLNLLQMLNLPYSEQFDVVKLHDDTGEISYMQKPDEIYHDALENFAQIQAAKLHTQSAQKGIAATKGALYPSLTFGGNINTNYSTAASLSELTGTSEITSPNYVVVSGSKLPVIAQQNIYQSSRIPYSSQVSNNLFSTLSLNLNIPIFNAFRVKNKIKLAKIAYENAQYIEANSKNELQQSIERAYINLSGTIEKYHLIQDQVNAFAESFRGAEIRFNNGVLTSVDYLIAKNNLDRAKTGLIISKYDFLLRSKILDYYSGKINY